MSRNYYLCDMDPALHTYSQSHTFIIKDKDIDINKFFGYGIRSKYLIFEIAGTQITGLITGLQVKNIGSNMELEITFVDYYLDKQKQLTKLDIEFDVQIPCDFCYIPTHVTIWEKNVNVIRW